MKKIKILQFPIGDTKGGITQYVLTNWKFIDKEKFQFDFATMSSKLSFEKELLDSGANVFYIKSYAEDDVRGFEERFRDILTQENYDIVHLHTSFWKSLSAEKIAREANVKGIIVHAHASAVVGTKANNDRGKMLERHNKVLSKFSQQEATDFWSCSNEATKFLFADKIPSDKVRTLYNAIDTHRFCYNLDRRNSIRREMKLGNNLVLGYVARFEYPKNQIFLLRLMEMIKKEGWPVKLMLVGQGIDLAKCQAFVAEKELDDYVIFTGFRSDVEDLLQAFDVVVFPSENEGFPISLVEAQASGLYCLVSDNVKGDIDITGRIRLLPLVEAVWCDNIFKLIDNKIVLDRVNTKSIVESGFDIHSQIKVVESMYEEIAKRKN